MTPDSALLPQTNAKDLPADTRERLLQAASRIFAEQGFQNATVREISALVGANVAAVNYHFGDKLGLYTEVLRCALMAEEDLATRELVAAASTPQEALRVFISRMLARTVLKSEVGLQFRIMAQEISQPTPALAQVVDEVIRPKFKQLCQVIGLILGISPDHQTTRMCSHSLIGQIMHYANAQPVISLLSPDWELNRHLDDVAAHIYRFTLHGLLGLAAPKASVRKDANRQTGR